MTWANFRNLCWLLLFNGIAVFVSVQAALKAFAYHDFFWATFLAGIASAYIFGAFISLIRHRLAVPFNDRLRAAGIYFFAAITTALTLDDLLFLSTASGRPYAGWSRVFVFASLSGSLVLALAALVVLIKPRYGHLAASGGATLLFPYFVLLAWGLPWYHLIWLVTIHQGGELQVLSVFSLAAAMICTVLKISRRDERFTAKPYPASK